ncbi:MAG: glutaredoxin family protein [Burkholderiaceae bacterium]|jgi:glutaredoxin
MKHAMLLMFLLSCWCGLAQAQYKYVGPNGEITYSDIPPPPTAKGVQMKTFSSGPSSTGLPYDLQQAVLNFPVTLYTGEGCAPCDQARSYLKSRGVPYSEKTVTTTQDLEVLKKVSNDSNLPVLSVGPQKVNGFVQSSLASLLDDAGYPSSSKLPQGYINPAAVAAGSPQGTNTTAQAAPSPTSSAAPLPGPPPASGNAPPGFKF